MKLELTDQATTNSPSVASEYSANLLFSTTMIKIQDESSSSYGKLLLVAQIVLKAISFFLHVIFSFGQVYIPVMLLHLLNSFRFSVQVGETIYVPLAEAGDHQVEQQKPDSF